MPAKNNANDRLANALALLEALSAAGDAGIGTDAFMREQGIGTEELAQARDIIAALADRETGARVHVDERGGRLFLTGTDGRMLPLRLSLSEGLVLAHLIKAATIDAETKREIESALLPFGAGSDLGDVVSSTSSPGPWIAAINEAVEFGIRTELTYRSQGEPAPRARVVDPMKIEARDGKTYLIAWDIDEDGRRCYRFDRITDVQKTDDSVVEHDWKEGEDAGFGFARDNKIVQVSLPTRAADYTNWAGITERSVCKTDPDRTILSVRVASSNWLFEQVLAGGGTIRIENDEALAKEFQAWAQSLKI